MAQIISERVGPIRFFRNLAMCMLNSTIEELGDETQDGADVNISSPRFIHLTSNLQEIFTRPNATLYDRMLDCITCLDQMYHDYNVDTFFRDVMQMLLYVHNDLKDVKLSGWNEFCDLIGILHEFEYVIVDPNMIQHNISCVSPSKLDDFISAVWFYTYETNLVLPDCYDELIHYHIHLEEQANKHNRNANIGWGAGFIVAILCIIAASVVHAKALIAFKLSVALLPLSCSAFIALVIVCIAIKCCKASQSSELINPPPEEIPGQFKPSPEKTPGQFKPSPEKTPAKTEPLPQDIRNQTFDS